MNDKLRLVELALDLYEVDFNQDDELLDAIKSLVIDMLVEETLTYETANDVEEQPDEADEACDIW